MAWAYLVTKTSNVKIMVGHSKILEFRQTVINKFHREARPKNQSITNQAPLQSLLNNSSEQLHIERTTRPNFKNQQPQNDHQRKPKMKPKHTVPKHHNKFRIT